MGSEGKLFVISAPSGTGKTTVVRRLLKQHPELVESISYTTRPPRTGEKDHTDYHFVDDPTFKKLVEEDFFAEWAEVHGAMYGTPVNFIDEALKRGSNVVLDVDVQGGMSLKKRFPNAVTIFLLPPNEEELVKRLSERGTEDKAQISRRLNNAKQEMIFKDKYDHRVINDEVDQAVKKLIRLIFGIK
jgi:guanylate kinase